MTPGSVAWPRARATKASRTAAYAAAGPMSSRISASRRTRTRIGWACPRGRIQHLELVEPPDAPQRRGHERDGQSCVGERPREILEGVGEAGHCHVRVE